MNIDEATEIVRAFPPTLGLGYRYETSNEVEISVPVWDETEQAWEVQYYSDADEARRAIRIRAYGPDRVAFDDTVATLRREGFRVELSRYAGEPEANVFSANGDYRGHFSPNYNLDVWQSYGD